MTRTTSAALDTELAKTISEIGYLVQVGTLTPQRWSNIGQVSWNSLTWLDKSFELTGLSFNPDEELSATLTISNHDGTAATLFNNPAEHLYDVVVVVYEFARGALSLLDVPLMGTLTVNSCEITPAKVTLQLRDQNTNAKFSPRRRICPAEGFNFATQEGLVISWNGEIYTVEPDPN